MKLERCFRNCHHRLILKEKKLVYNESDEDVIICRICTRVIAEGYFYACDDNNCQYYLHDFCANIPNKINHHTFHPSHSLMLIEERTTWCNSCRQYFGGDPIYYCSSGCRFDLCVECALMAVESRAFDEGRQPHRIHDFSHRHSLSLLNSVNVDEYEYPLCNVCGSSIATTLTFSSSDNLYYGCTDCNFFLHEWCVGFPRKLHHPLHRDHGFLSLSSNIQDFGKCFSCERSNSSRKGDLFYKCCDYDCRFQLCWSCKDQKVRRSIMYEGHDHKLEFVEKTADVVDKCNAYDGYCTQPVMANCGELKHSKSSIHRCLDCDFRLHMLCGPLPATIKHESHIHNLTLVDWLVEEDYDECYCDVCETKRDPRIRLYYCNECKYFAHVHCLFSEIAKALTGDDDKLLELKIVGQDIWSLPSDQFRYSEHKIDLTFNDVIKKLTRKELYDLKRRYTWDDNDTSSTNEGQIRGNYNNIITTSTPQSDQLMSSQDVDEILRLIDFTYSDFETFFKEQLDAFYWCEKLPFNSSDLKLKTVNVEGYTVPHTVGRVMRALLHNYGDIHTIRNNSREWNSIVYFLVCEVLQRMATTLVIDITKVDLQEWYYHLTFAKFYGFKVDFAHTHLEKLVRAFWGLRVDKLKDQVPEMLTKKIAKAQSQLGKVERYNSGSSERPQFITDFLKEGSDMKLKKAFRSDQDFTF